MFYIFLNGFHHGKKYHLSLLRQKVVLKVMECAETRGTSVLGGISLWSFRSKVHPQGSEAEET